MATCAVTGTIGDGAVETDVKNTGGTIILTLTGDTWIAGDAGFPFSDDFTTDPAGRWTQLWNTMSWSSGQYVTPTGGGAASFNTTTGSTTQYVKLTLADAAGTGGIVLRSTGTGSDGFYVVFHYSGTIYLIAANNSGTIENINTGTLSFAQNDTMAVTITGIGAAVVVSVWKNPTNNSPVDVSSWDTGADDPDITITPPDGTYTYAGYFVGIGFDDIGAEHDNFYGGAVA